MQLQLGTDLSVILDQKSFTDASHFILTQFEPAPTWLPHSRIHGLAKPQNFSWRDKCIPKTDFERQTCLDFNQRSRLCVSLKPNEVERAWIKANKDNILVWCSHMTTQFCIFYQLLYEEKLLENIYWDVKFWKVQNLEWFLTAIKPHWPFYKNWKSPHRWYGASFHVVNIYNLTQLLSYLSYWSAAK